MQFVFTILGKYYHCIVSCFTHLISTMSTICSVMKNRFDNSTILALGIKNFENEMHLKKCKIVPIRRKLEVEFQIHSWLLFAFLFSTAQFYSLFLLLFFQSFPPKCAAKVIRHVIFETCTQNTFKVNITEVFFLFT